MGEHHPCCFLSLVFFFLFFPPSKISKFICKSSRTRTDAQWWDKCVALNRDLQRSLWGEVRYYEERAERRHKHREKTKHAEPLTTCHHLIHNTTNNTSDVRFYKGRAIHEAGGHAAALPDSRPATATTLLSLSSPQLFLLFAIIRPLSSPCAPLWSSAPPLRQAGWSAQRCRPSVWCQESHTGSSEDKKKRKKERKKTRCEAVPNARHAGVCTPCDECSQRWNTGTTSLRWEARTPRSGWVWEGRRQWQGEGDSVFFFLLPGRMRDSSTTADKFDEICCLCVSMCRWYNGGGEVPRILESRA